MSVTPEKRESAPEVDRDMLVKFAATLFRNAKRDGFVSFRIFLDNGKREGPVKISAVRLDDFEFEALMMIDAEQAATWHEPAVFAPPVCTFKNSHNAKTDNIHEGPALSVECDSRPGQARATLEALLGPVTLMSTSGGEWINDETGEVEPRGHLHWRLKKPAGTIEEQTMLYEARSLAAKLAGSDPSAIPIVHPLRWPGSLHRKKTPKLARIAAISEDSEIDLGEALERLREAADAAGVARPSPGLPADRHEASSHSVLVAALAAIPNDSALRDEKGVLIHDWTYWNWTGMTIWASTSGSEEGRLAFHEWSAKAKKYNKDTTEKRWQHYFRSPPTRLGFGSLFYRASQANPNWHNEHVGAAFHGIGGFIAQVLHEHNEAEDTASAVPRWLQVMLAIKNQVVFGGTTYGPFNDAEDPGAIYGPYKGREALLSAFLTRCVSEGIADEIIFEGCLNDAYYKDLDGAIHSHCREQSDPRSYLEQQIALAKAATATEDDEEDEPPPASTAPTGGSVSLSDFYAYMPRKEAYIFAPDGALWPASSVDARLPKVPLLKKDGTPLRYANGKPKTMWPSDWLSKYSAVEQATWAPGEPNVVKDRLISEGGWFERKGCHVFNLYKPPIPVPPSTEQPTIWLDHLRLIYPEDAGHIIAWLAHRAQRPEEKINHALVLGGSQGIGKDTILAPVRRAVGLWNFKEVTPQQAYGRFNGHLKAVVLRVSEARDLGEYDRFGFYEHMKVVTAAPPEVLRVDEKNLREHDVLNVCGVVYTTNNKSNGIYLPADDRRHYVAWSNFNKTMFDEAYWNKIWKWYIAGGLEITARYLLDFDLKAAGFDPKAPPRQTEAFWEIVNASRAPEDAEMADALDGLARQIERARLSRTSQPGSGSSWLEMLTPEQMAEQERLDEQVDAAKPEWPKAVTLEQVRGASTSYEFSEYLKDRRNSRKIPHRLESCGYTAVRSTAKDGQWVLDGRRQAIYALTDLDIRRRFEAAQQLEAAVLARAAEEKAKAAADKKATEEAAKRTQAEAKAKPPPKHDGGSGLGPRPAGWPKPQRRQPGDR